MKKNHYLAMALLLTCVAICYQGCRLEDSPKPLIQAAIPKASSPRASSKVIQGFDWIVGTSVTYQCQSTLLIRGNALDSNVPDVQLPILDFKVSGRYHLHVAEVSTSVKIVALLEPDQMSNIDESLPDKNKAIFSQTPFLITLTPEGSLVDLRFPVGADPEFAKIVSQIFNWQFVLKSGLTEWAINELNDEGVLYHFKYRVQSDGSINKVLRASKNDKSATVLKQSFCLGIPGRVWLDFLEGSEKYDLIQDGHTFGSFHRSLHLERIKRSIPKSIMDLDANSFKLITATSSPEERMHQMTASEALKRLQIIAAENSSSESIAQAGHDFCQWFAHNRENASFIVEALKLPLAEKITQFLVRALADYAPEKAAEILFNSELYSSTVTFQQAVSLGTSDHLSEMPDIVGSALADAAANTNLNASERDAAFFALGSFAAHRDSWLSALWQEMRPRMHPEADIVSLANDFRVLANSGRLIPEALSMALQVGIHHDSRDVRLAAIEYLGVLKNSAIAREELGKTSKSDKDQNVRDSATQMLK